MSSLLRMLVVVAIVTLPSAIVRGQQANPTNSKLTIQSTQSNGLAPIQNHATDEQLRKYFELSGELNLQRQRWVMALDENRSIGAPYWPESFWTDLKLEMLKFDLAPGYIGLYQHYISKETMQSVIDAYKSLGPENFPGSEACVKWSEQRRGMEDDANKLNLSNLMQINDAVYARYKAQIASARVKYKTEHPDWVDK
jgi:hypothetical protein